MRRYAPESETERRSTTRPRQCTATSERRCSEVAFDRASRVEIFTDNEQFNDWINRSAADLQLLITETRHGLYPYAGVPWLSTPFGRGGLITALQTLWSQPSIATDARPSDPLRTVRCRVMPKRRCVGVEPPLPLSPRIKGLASALRAPVPRAVALRTMSLPRQER